MSWWLNIDSQTTLFMSQNLSIFSWGSNRNGEDGNDDDDEKKDDEKVPDADKTGDNTHVGDIHEVHGDTETDALVVDEGMAYPIIHVHYVFSPSQSLFPSLAPLASPYQKFRIHHHRHL